MSIFKGLTSEGMEEREDRLGGFSRLDTDVYTGKIKVMYAGASASGAQNVTIVADVGGQEYRETVYITNKKGENFFVKDGKKVALPGFNIIDDLCQVCTDKTLSEQTTEEKVVKIWDPETRTEQPKAVPVLTEMTGAEILVAIDKVLENKNEKQGDEYVATAETRESNTIAHVFHPTLRVTVNEAKKGKTGPDNLFIDAWTDKNRGKTRDKRSIKDGDAGQNGRPAKANAGPPQAGAKPAARKSLFGG